MSKPLLIAFTALLITTPASADPLLEMMRTHTKDGPVYAYEMQYADGEITATGRIDPSQPEGQRIAILTPDEAIWSDEFKDGLKTMEAEAEGDIWCVDFAETVPTSATRSTETTTSATYAFTPLPDTDSDRTEKKLMKKIKAEVTLDKADGAILNFSMTLPKPYKPMMIAKINVFNLRGSCTRAPDGRTYLQDFSMVVSGSAMMQKFSDTTNRTITALLDPVG